MVKKHFKTFSDAMEQLSSDIGATAAAIVYEYSVGAAKVITELWAEEIIEALRDNKFGYTKTSETGIMLVESGTLIESLRFNVDNFYTSGERRSRIYISTVDGSIEPRTKEPTEKVLAWLHFGVTSDKVNIPERPFIEDALKSIGYSRIFTESYNLARKRIIARGFAKSALYARRRSGKALTAVEAYTITPKLKRDSKLTGRISVNGNSLSFVWEDSDDTD